MKGVGSECNNAVICQTKPTTLSLGDAKTVEYYVAGKVMFLPLFCCIE